MEQNAGPNPLTADCCEDGGTVGGTRLTLANKAACGNEK